MDLSLEDIIQQNRRQGRGRGRGSSALRGVRRGGISRRTFGGGELFREFGTIRRATIHYDRSGRPLGTAEVLFANPQSASKARSHYNGVPLDGRPMVIQLVGAGPTSQTNGRTRGATARTVPSRRFPVVRRRGTLSTRPGNRGRGRSRRPAVSREQLDAELAAYNSQRG